jgi:hypothetical protein
MSTTPPREAQLERYLQEVAGRLSAPPRRRDEELAELAQHLDELASRNEARGLSRAEAAAAAVEAFGDPGALAQDLGRALRRAGRRDGALQGIAMAATPLWLGAVLVPGVEAWLWRTLRLSADLLLAIDVVALFALRWLRDRDDLRRWPRGVYAFDGTVERHVDERPPQIVTLFGNEPPR